MTRSAGGTTPGGKGSFDGYDVMAERRRWDPVTARVVDDKMAPPDRGLLFFTEEEATTAGALVDLLLAQHDEPKVAVVQAVDRRLHAGETDGWRYEELPEDSVAWRRSLALLDEDAKEAFGSRFSECAIERQGEVLQGIQDAETWHGWPARHVWSLWTRYACAAFYGHPWAWNEIGFGGPAYPRGYKVLRAGWIEPWERRERDSEDPVPWAERGEHAKRDHEVRTRGER